jgi:hypothetical protein
LTDSIQERFDCEGLFVKKPLPSFANVCGGLLLLLTAVSWYGCWRLAKNLPLSDADVLAVKVLPQQMALVAEKFVVQKGTAYQLTIEGQLPVPPGRSINAATNIIGFEIRSNDVNIVSRNSYDLNALNPGGVNIAQTLSRFHVEPGASYFLKLWFVSSAVDSPTDPLIVRVSRDRATMKNQAVAISILGPLSLFLTILSVLFMVRWADEFEWRSGFHRA